MVSNNEGAPTSGKAPRISWLSLVFLALAIITFFISSGGTLDRVRTLSIGSSDSLLVPQAPSEYQDEIMPDSYPIPPRYGYGDVSVTDTREFLKIGYHATLRTRAVQELTRRVETTVRGFGGRIDQIASSQKSGYVSFVVPKSKYEAFRDELESFVGPRFLSINISSQNLLPQKISIEERQKQTEENLATLNADRKKLVSTHAQTVASLQTQIDADAVQLATLRAQTTTDPAQQAQITTQIEAVFIDQANLKVRLTDENATYKQQLNSLDADIKYAQAELEGVKTQDQNLLDTVETVQGTVSINWISLWEIAQLYLPGFWIPAIFAALAVLAHAWHRRWFESWYHTQSL